MNKPKIIKRIKELNDTFDPDGSIDDFAYAANELFDEVLQDEQAPLSFHS